MTLKPGKLPSHLLAGLLAHLPLDDPRVVLGPGVGRDAAVVDAGGGRLLALKMDPVTLAADGLGWYAVHVNANDIACVGATPRWMLATLLLPPGSPEPLAGQIMQQLTAAAAGLGVTVVGGHTEITLGLDRPIVAGAMVGELSRDDLITGEGVRDGDAVLLTQGVAVEGTALLARDAPDRLRAAGLTEELIARAAALLREPGISIVGDAQLIGAHARPRLLHDPTEGGLATALEELSIAAGAPLRIDADAIHILPETRTLCDALGLDALGLLASGALLAVVEAADADRTQAAVEAAGRTCRVIGAVGAGHPGVIMARKGRETPLPRFERDELARFLDAPAEQTRNPEGSDA